MRSIKGVAISRNTATLKEGYSFLRINDNRVAVIKTLELRRKVEGGKTPRKYRAEVSGTFSCACGDGGKCSLEINRRRIRCKPGPTGGCKQTCLLRAEL